MLLIDGYYLDGYRGIPHYLNKIINGLNPDEMVFLCVKNTMKLPENIHKKYKVIRLPDINVIIWEQLLIPIIAYVKKAERIWSPANTFGLIFLFTSKKIIVTLHDLIFFEKYSLNTHYFQKIGVLYRRFIWSFYKWFNNIDIISVSETTKKELENKFGLESKVIYHGVDLPQYQKERNRNLDSLPDSFCFHLGSISPSKGTEIALDEFSKCAQLIKKGWKCIVVGKLYEADFFNKYKNNNAFIFYEYVSGSDLQFLYKHCKLFLSTSIKEGFGFGPLEAIISGAPTLVLKSEIADEILGNIGFPTVPKQLFSDKIQELVLKNSHNDFSEACMNYYQWSKSVEKHHSILF
ncbi:MAG: glycosyltransferase [Candidatus Marinamargulisbacteria bacterium]